jgi:AcrR family transcriptional regulator
MVASTRERILDVAMELFGQHGYKGTSIVQIETAVGLTPGAGGVYHHFRTKEAVLEAGIERHLGRLDALRDLQRILTGLGDLRSELTVLGRYALAELDSEADLLRIVLSEARSRPELVDTAINQLIRATYAGFADWLRDRADLPPGRAESLAAVGLGSLFSTRLLRLLLGRDPIEVGEDDFLNTWVDTMYAQITS